MPCDLFYLAHVMISVSQGGLKLDNNISEVQERVNGSVNWGSLSPPTFLIGRRAKCLRECSLLDCASVYICLYSLYFWIPCCCKGGL